MDKLQLLELLKSNKNKSGYYSKETTWIRLFPENYNELQNLIFPYDFTFQQKVYHYLNNDYKLELGICPTCLNRSGFIGILYGYRKFCSCKCAQNNDIVRNKQISSCIEHFGCQNPSQSEIIKDKRKQTCIKRYSCENPFQTEDVKEKIKETCLERYGCENPFQNKEIQEKQKQTCLERYDCENPFQSEEIKDKIKETCLDRYGCENPMQSNVIQEKVIKTCLKKYNSDYYFHSDSYKEYEKIFQKQREQTCLNKYGKSSFSKTTEFKKKRYYTLKKNNTFNTSKIEDQLKQYLDKNNIYYVYQYTSEQYPFNCDFYFPDKDLYVEIQGTWTHGPQPFTGSEEDKILLEKWKSRGTDFYKSAIETWTVRDVRKRETAKKNNLNYLEIFSIDLGVCIKEISNALKK